MAINYPTSLDSLSNPSAIDALNNVTTPHATQHGNLNDIVEALEAKVGINGSAVTTSHDYKLSAVTSTAKALTSGTSTQSVTNLTLVTPTLTIGSDATGDMYYRNSGGGLSKLALGTTGQVVAAGAGGTPEYTTIAANQDASTTVKGVVELATAAEINAGTATGSTGAALVVTPDQLALSSYVASSDFGDGSDGAVTVNSGAFSSGPITSNALTRDAYFTNLTINSTFTLDANGFRIFVTGTLTFIGTGKIINNGGAGGTGGTGNQGASVGAGGSAGAAAATGGSLPDTLPGVAGGAGASGASANTGSVGTVGTAAAKSLGTTGTAGGAGATGGTAASGTGPGAGGAGGLGGAQTGTVFNRMNSIASGYYLIDNQPTIVTLTGTTGSGGGGGGGGGRSTNAADCGAGGGGGGSGAPGGFLWIAAKNIVTADGNVYAQADGGAGGTGGAGGNSTGNNGGGGSGGGGGAGGSGGVAIIFYNTKTGTGTVSVAAGAGGVGGAGNTGHGTGTAGTSGATGTAGTTGTTYVINII